MGLHIQPRLNLTTSHTHVLTLITRDRANTAWALTVHLTPMGEASIDWNPLSSNYSSRSAPYLVRLEDTQWNPLMLTVKLETGEILTNVNGTLQMPNLEILPSDQLNSWKGEADGMERHVGLLIGSAFRFDGEGGQPTTYKLQSINLETPDMPRKRIPRWRSNVLSSIPMNPLNKVSSLRFPENGFVKFEFRNRLRKNTDRESLTIEFDLPDGVTDGLIWFSENKAAKSYVYIKVSFEKRNHPGCTVDYHN